MMEDIHAIKAKYCSAPGYNSSYNQPYNPMGTVGAAAKSYSDEASNRTTLQNGGWRCPSCNRVHPSYETSCVCGVVKPVNGR